MRTFHFILLTLIPAFLVLCPINTFANCQGCCSNNGGVVCTDGTTRCADGTSLSATCQAKGCDKCGSMPASSIPTSVSKLSVSSGRIKVAAFNIQVFGVAKASKPDVMDVLAETIAEFDIVAIQEIRDSSGMAIIDLENAVEALGVEYDVVVGPRLGRTTSKEQYAYIYRTATVDYNESYTYDDSILDLFHREPLVASFSTVTGKFDFVLAVIHTDPDEATKEIGSLPLVIQDAKTHYPGELDIIVLGDFNADCSYFDEDDMTCPLRDDPFTWLITNDMDTNVAATSCTYDRVVITVDTLSETQVDAGVYRFDQIFGLTEEETKDISDHYPVWVEISYPDGSSSTDGSSSGGGCFIETFIKDQGVF